MVNQSFQVGLLWLPHSIEAGLFVINVYAVWRSFSFLMLLLETVLLCEALSDPTVSIGRFHSMYQIATFFCSVHVRLLHCNRRNLFLLLQTLHFDIQIQRRHIKLGKDEL